MELDAITIRDLLNGGAWTVVVYLWAELKKLHKERHDEQKAQLELFQRVALKASGDD